MKLCHLIAVIILFDAPLAVFALPLIITPTTDNSSLSLNGSLVTLPATARNASSNVSPHSVKFNRKQSSESNHTWHMMEDPNLLEGDIITKEMIGAYYGEPNSTEHEVRGVPPNYTHACCIVTSSAQKWLNCA